MMKILQKLSVAAFLLTIISPVALAQNHDDGAVSIRINGKKQDIEEYFEDWGRKIEKSVEQAFEGKTRISIDFDDEDIDLEIGDFAFEIGDMIESIAETVAHAVTHMDIEISDIDPDDLHDSRINLNDTDLEDLIDEIEDRYDSKVEKIEKMKIKIREDYVKIDMNVKLENGRRIDKMQIIHHD